MDYISKIEGHPIKAECLKESPRLTNKTPYLFRPSYANGYGYETLIGGTCGVNQLVYQPTIWAQNHKGFKAGTSFVQGHKILMSVGGTNSSMLYAFIYSNIGGVINNSMNVAVGNTAIFNCPFTQTQTVDEGHDTTDTVWIFVYSDDYASWQNPSINIIDLTQMFGTTIADYVYTLESGTSGAGITWLKNNGFFGADYYPYNAGGLLSVKTSGKITTGKNLWNGETKHGYIYNGNYYASDSYWCNKNPIRVMPNTAYIFSGVVSGGQICCYDENNTYLGNDYIYAPNATFTTPANCHYVSIYNPIATETADKMLEFGLTATAYEPYTAHECPLDGSRKVHRVFGIVDLGSLNWSYIGENGIFVATIADIVNTDVESERLSVICSDYSTPASIPISWADVPDKSCLTVYTNNQIAIKDVACTNTSDFVTHLQNVNASLVYQLETPFDETVSNPELRGILKLDSNNNLYYYGDTCSDFTNPMIVDGNGTEEFVDGRTVEMPVGHSTIYVDNSDKTKLDNLPDISDSGDGKYLIKQENGKQSLVIPNATDISYSNTSSGLTATKVQGAIDEVNTKVGTKANSSDVYTKSNTYNKTEVNSMLTLVKSATGNPCTFTTDLADALVSLTADVVCGQDLHGYDHPWPSGGGKNKIDVSNGNGTTMRGVMPSYDNNGGLTFAGTVTEVGWCGSWVVDFTLPAGTYTFSISNPEIDHNITFALDWSAIVVIDRNTASKTVTFNAPQRINRITLNSNAEDVGQNININAKKFQIELGSTATPYEPYANICPLVGHSELNLTRCGKNLFDKTTTIDDNWINSSGSAVYFAGGFYSALIPVKPDTAYYLSNVIGGNDFVSSVHFDNNMNVIGAKNVSGTSIQSGSITTFNNSAYMRINSNTANKDTVMVSEGSTPSAYSPYNGQTFTVAFGQTVYGGVYDKSGRLMITHGFITYDGSNDEDWGFVDAVNRAYISVSDIDISTPDTDIADVKANIYVSGAYSGNGNRITGRYNIAQINVFDSSVNNITEWRALLSNTPMTVAYELATPIVIDVPSISVFAENGTNNIVSDGGGDIAVKYADGDLADQIIQIIKAYIKEETNNET